MYTRALFSGARPVHMGVDLGGPVGTAVHAFSEGVVLHSGVNPTDGAAPANNVIVCCPITLLAGAFLRVN